MDVTPADKCPCCEGDSAEWPEMDSTGFCTNCGHAWGDHA